MTRCIIKTGKWNPTALREARLAAGLSQNALATRMRDEPGCEKTSNVHVRKWEADTTPNATALAALSRVLNVPMERLMEVREP